MKIIHPAEAASRIVSQVLLFSHLMLQWDITKRKLKKVNPVPKEELKHLVLLTLKMSKQNTIGSGGGTKELDDQRLKNPKKVKP